MCKDYPEYDELRSCQRAFAKAHQHLMDRLVADAETATLKADRLIKDLFGAAHPVPTTPELIEKARMRHDVGNPPGKGDSLGDAVNWEALLQGSDVGVDLSLVSGNKHFCSDLDSNRLHGFLLDEWESRRSSKILFFKSLSAFFESQFPEIQLAAEAAKDFAIRDLATSPDFNETHRIIRRLRQFAELSPAQVNEVVSAALNNNQVYWIAGDEDVYTFLSELVRNYHQAINEDSLSELKELLDAQAIDDSADHEDESSF